MFWGVRDGCNTLCDYNWKVDLTGEKNFFRGKKLVFLGFG